jgi:hypothetical protein
MVSWQDYEMGEVDIEIWLRITTTGEYLDFDYLDKREKREYLSYYMNE